MNSPLIHATLAGLLLTHACAWRIRQSRQRNRTWTDLVALLNLDLITIGPVTGEDVEGLSRRVGGGRGIWRIYCHIPVLMAIADYVAEHGENIDEDLLCNLRADALQLRSSMLLLLVRYGLARSKADLSERMSRSIVAYREVLTKTSQLAEAHSAATAMSPC